ncbi:class I SAM-dependent methyltransferase [Amycolatopsis thermalba]|uniref:Class I SAM-dependent methyltransferase n=1 Tax=Amycolatopsis thermalba TaxID=944492 RepID=A0ABY4NUT5_9PSEU|nr:MULTISPECIES: class I SAM-dependent methyltransferase [Amycolatopsis]OXM72561.1 methylase [Amycolatopsis sp. KNN50.9b]UQS23819.1 class I SAM-dependent methyltransferase [Amycolatopsis thermalba]
MNPEAVAGVFTAARSEFTAWSARLWRPLGEILTAVARPRPGERVLDACCGAGASAIPAARAVGPEGSVDAVDIAEGLLDEGRREAAALGLHSLRFTAADVLAWPHDGYDVVQSSFGVFFFPDMDAGSRHLAGLLRPGGRFAVSAWRADGMARIVPIGRAAALPDNPGLADAPERPNHSLRIDTADKLGDWLSGIGLHDVEVREVHYVQPLHPDDAWTFYLGSAMRGFVTGLSPDALARVRDRFAEGLREAGLGTLDASALIGVGRTALPAR